MHKQLFSSRFEKSSDYLFLRFKYLLYFVAGSREIHIKKETRENYRSEYFEKRTETQVCGSTDLICTWKE